MQIHKKLCVHKINPNQYFYTPAFDSISLMWTEKVNSNLV